MKEEQESEHDVGGVQLRAPQSDRVLQAGPVARTRSQFVTCLPQAAQQGDLFQRVLFTNEGCSLQAEGASASPVQADLVYPMNGAPSLYY